ncbi:MAG: hypothetical protein QNK11_01140 [Legionella sp.]|nr:hypothetical protein [Legionella sp.]
MKKMFLFLTFFIWLSPAAASRCHPKPNFNLPQYIVGYGSLINESSKKKTSPSAKENFPVLISGYERSWSVRGGRKTYLSINKNENVSFNAVIYQLSNPKNIYLYDKRERSYCRKAVHINQLEIHGAKLPAQKQIWIYSSAHQTKEYPTEDFPIFQSYIDIFISGCFQIEEKFKIKSFAKDCIKSTSHWPTQWESGIVFPRHPASYEPYATKIDGLLIETLQPQPPFRLLPEVNTNN